jgi:mannose-1-phosphate guanylyltransferase/mannose-6-phosphate isomerase
MDRNRRPRASSAEHASMIVPVVLSGGSGARLWPLSRAMYPKQFIQFFDGQSSLLGATLRRVGGKPGFAEPVIVCNNDHRFLVRAELTAAGVRAAAIMLEPVARNTAAAIAAAALTLADDAVMAVLPTDHLLRDTGAFLDLLRRGETLAESGSIVLFGAAATRADTGYGYVRRGEMLDGDACRVAAFCEKPDATVAGEMLAGGDTLWNSGIVVARAGTLLAELERHAPEVVAAARDAVADADTDLGFLRLDAAAFARSPNVSIDKAVLENTSRAVILPMAFEWGDAATWASLWENVPQDECGNAIEGEAVLVDTANSLVHSERSLVATIGVRDLVIVDTPDALLVADRSRAQDVSALVTRLADLKRKEQQQHLRCYRPWGYFETLSLGARFQVKLLHVDPGGCLSMQMHHHRSEHWVVVCGTAKVTIGDEIRLVKENESVYITATQWHRLENPGKLPLEMIEVQLGSYLGEDDIVRSNDVYHRAPEETY